MPDEPKVAPAAEVPGASETIAPQPVAAPAATAAPKPSLSERVGTRLDQSNAAPPVPKQPEVKKEEPVKPAPQMVPIDALHAARKQAQEAKAAHDGLRERMTELERKIQSKSDTQQEKPAGRGDIDQFIRDNANDPFVKAYLGLENKVGELTKQLAAVSEVVEEGTERDAEAWVDRMMERLSKKYSELKDIFQVGADGAFSERLQSFANWAADRNLTGNDDDFERAFLGAFAEDLSLARVKRAEEDAIKRWQAGREAAATIGKPGVAAGSTAAFGQHKDLISRVEARLNAQGR